jgi:hypothetical protein
VSDQNQTGNLFGLPESPEDMHSELQVLLSVERSKEPDSSLSPEEADAFCKKRDVNILLLQEAIKDLERFIREGLEQTLEEAKDLAVEVLMKIFSGD